MLNCFKGRIACANVLSDLYAMGVEHCETVLMILGASTAMPADVRLTATELVMRGFNAAAHDAGTSVSGGQASRHTASAQKMRNTALKA